VDKIKRTDEEMKLNSSFAVGTCSALRQKNVSSVYKVETFSNLIVRSQTGKIVRYKKQA
jgi:hypothetical protein